MFSVAPTDIEWFNFLKENEYNSYVNFWTPTQWNIRQLKPGDRWYFLLKKPFRKLAGFGEFFEYQNLTAQEAWNKFGFRNGVETKTKFVHKIQSYIDKNSKVHGNQPIDINTYRIGCLTLVNCEYWEKDNYLDPLQFQINIPSAVVKYKFFYQDSINIEVVQNFSLLSEPRENYKALINKRRGAGVFKGNLLKAYNNQCCISAETCPELLEGAHIQEYLNSDSNHIQNGLLLRVDLHRLFDNNLLWIDNNYIIHISSFVQSEFYQKYNGLRINLPTDINNHPSKQALELRREFFRK